MTGVGEPIVVSCAMTVAVGVIATTLPSHWQTTGVGFAFLAAVWWLVWSRDDETVRRCGLAMGGLVIPGPIDVRGAAAGLARALAWAAVAAATVSIPFFLLWRRWWSLSSVPLSIPLAMRPFENWSDVSGQVFVIALPEEAFYRGYLQSRFDQLWGARWSVFGAKLGPGCLVSAGIFALGHLVTVHSPGRLAVFVPALAFGWLRARTGGIGASILFHAFCNLYSEGLSEAYAAQAIGRGS
jgi:hypothetical protein